MPKKKKKIETNEHIQLRILREAAERSGGSFIAFYINEDGNHMIYKELGNNNASLGLIRFIQTWSNTVADLQENSIISQLTDKPSPPSEGQEI